MSMTFNINKWFDKMLLELDDEQFEKFLKWTRKRRKYLKKIKR